MTQPSIVRPQALAIFGPKASEKNLAPFARGADITPVETLSGSEKADAVLVFGGDGTVHRQLPALAQSQVPLLAVPVGSGNDFSRALGTASLEEAFTAWGRFCREGANVRSIDLGVITPSGAPPEYF